jgi:small subunit ribosomal protein S16
MLSIRLQRVGQKNAPSYRIVVMPKHRDPQARNTEILGHYNPRLKPRELTIKADRVKHWISKGAQVTDTVWNLLVEEKIVEGKKRSVTHITKKRAGKMVEKAEEKKQADEEAKAKAEEEKVKAAAAAQAKAEEEAAAKEAENVAKEEAAKAEETSAEEKVEEVKEESATEDKKADEEKPAEEVKEEAPAKETPAEEVKEEKVEEKTEEAPEVAKAE